MIYRIPSKYEFRIHHCRPRFKGNIENVLIYMATEITRIGDGPSDEFNNSLNNAIRCFPGNADRAVHLQMRRRRGHNTVRFLFLQFLSYRFQIVGVKAAVLFQKGAESSTAPFVSYAWPQKCVIRAFSPAPADTGSR